MCWFFLGVLRKSKIENMIVDKETLHFCTSAWNQGRLYTANDRPPAWKETGKVCWTELPSFRTFVHSINIDMSSRSKYQETWNYMNHDEAIPNVDIFSMILFKLLSTEG